MSAKPITKDCVTWTVLIKSSESLLETQTVGVFCSFVFVGIYCLFGCYVRFVNIDINITCQIVKQI